MTRGIVQSGRKGTEIFPETGKELGRRVALTETVYLWKATSKDDGGGSYEPNWEKVENSPIRARFDSYKRAKPRGVVADKIDEHTDHIITLDVGPDVDPPDRIERTLDGSMWEVIAVAKRTDEQTIQLQAKEI